MKDLVPNKIKGNNSIRKFILLKTYYLNSTTKAYQLREEKTKNL